MTCAKCGFANVEDGVACPGCLDSSANFDAVDDPALNPPISSDFQVGNVRIGIERIRGRLLDLTNRNKLLNFRHSPRSSLPIVAVVPNNLFDSLLEGEAISFKPVPEPNTRSKPSVVDHARQIGIPISVDLPDPGLLPVLVGKPTKTAQTLNYPNDLEAILRRISYASRTAVEESGTNMLHLIFGFLEWFESDSSEQPHLAPLVLVPVTIQKAKASPASGTFTYEITYSSADQVQENLSLREKLERDFGLDMPELLDGEAPEAYFAKFQGILSARRRWRVRRRITLGLVSFGKLLMFRDLDPKNWPAETDLTEHSLIRNLFEGTKLSQASFADEYPLDAPEHQKRVPGLIYDADSSQHSALIDALEEEKNLVIEGPPGTGKSQTITNLIGLALDKGKTVLFVSEKLAALEVVRRRLDSAGLGLFCLELHSHKTDKRKLLDDLEERLAARGSIKEPKDLDEKRTLLQRAKQQLLEYADLINTPFSALGLTGFDIIWRRERLRQELPFSSNLIDKIVIDRGPKTHLADIESDRQILDIYGRQLTDLRARFPDVGKHPWRQLSNASLDFSQQKEVLLQLETILSSVRQLRTIVEHLASVAGGASAQLDSREAAGNLVANIDQIPRVHNSAMAVLNRIAGDSSCEREVLRFCSNVTSWKKANQELLVWFSTIAEAQDPANVEPLRRACAKAVEFGLGDFDGVEFEALLKQCESLRTIVRKTSVLNRESLAGELSTCESATMFSRIFGSAYRRAKRMCKETFVLQKWRRTDMTKVLRAAVSFLDKLSSDNSFVPSRRVLVSYEDLGELAETARSLISSFGSYKLEERRTPRQVLAAIAEFVDNFNTGATIVNNHAVRGLLGPLFEGMDTDLPLVSGVINVVNGIRRAHMPEGIRAWLLHADTDARLSLLRAEATEIGGQLSDLDAALARFCHLGGINSQEWWGPELLTFVTLERIAQAALDEADSLAGWLDFQRAAKNVESAHLSELVKLCLSNAISVSDILPAYDYVLYNTLAEGLARDHPELLQFSGLSLEAVRDQFARLDREVIELNRQLAALHASKSFVPSGVSAGPVNQLTELGLITHEIMKKKRHLPIRQLMRRAGIALQALKPCFMMSPLSVAQYLVPGQLKFDLLVMDEASQLKPEDALGAIARTAQVVVVGDPKQLPPSTFFERQFDVDSEEESPDDASTIEEHESILDVAMALYQPIRQLRWHYRSRDESLIAFSNKEFYRNRLLVFPSPARRVMQQGIQFEHVADAVYEAGGSKCNRSEAERVVNMIVNHTQAFPGLSLGVVALNYQQRELIDDLLMQRIRNDEVAQHFLERHEKASEPLFIKNLENVQGDERDVIVISITYGRDRDGNFFQRFGPINQEQGPRRLNVLFTRAKHKVVVFSSIDPDEIRTDASSSRGIVLLKAYLNYAKSGQLETEAYTASEPESDFEISVSNALKLRGFKCEAQIGVAGFFIDIGVRHPEKPGVFALGIECDGASYHSAKSARDRDRLRQMILENLGWKIHRIWSTDWFKDRQREIDKVVQRLQQIISHPA